MSCGNGKKKKDPGVDVVDGGADVPGAEDLAAEVGVDTPFVDTGKDVGVDIGVDTGVDIGEDVGVDTAGDIGEDGGQDVSDTPDGGSDCADMPEYEDTREVKVGTETTTICPYCGCGCGLVVTTVDGKITNTEGNPDHPINQGALCSKGQALYQVANNELRQTKVLHRAPGAADWTEVSWEDALDGIAAKIKETRDATFIEKDGNDNVVNRTDAIGSLGSAALDNEECYALSKLLRAMGLVYIEHQARI